MLKNSTGWVGAERHANRQSLQNPRKPITEWIERAVFVFELSITPHQSQNIEFVAAVLDQRKIDISLCNAVTWHGMLVDQGLISNTCEHPLLEIACSVCDMVNVNWSIDEDSVDTVAAVNLVATGVYASLIDTLAIILHKHKAELQ